MDMNSLVQFSFVNRHIIGLTQLGSRLHNATDAYYYLICIILGGCQSSSRLRVTDGRLVLLRGDRKFTEMGDLHNLATILTFCLFVSLLAVLCRLPHLS